MIKTSTSYKTKIIANKRRNRPLIIADFDTEWYFRHCIPTATSYYDDSTEPFQAVNGRWRTTNYTGAGYIPCDLFSVQKGWWTGNNSDGSGDFASPEILTIQYIANCETQSFWVIGYDDNYPVDFKIEISSDGIAWKEIVDITGNGSALYYIHKTYKQNFTYCRITITKISAINSPAKIIQCGAITTVVFDYRDVAYMKMNEEGKAESGHPLGLICSNVFNFNLKNDNRYFTYDYSSSPFAKLFQKSFRFRPYVGLDMGSDEYNFIPLGKYWNHGDSYRSEELTAKFTGYDRMYQFLKEAPPMLSVVDGTTIYEMWELLFQGVGLSKDYDYFIEHTLNQQITYGYFKGETIEEVFQDLSVAGNCWVSVNRFGVFVVKSNFKKETPSITIHDSDQIFEAKNLQDEITKYDAVKIRYNLERPLGGEKEVVYINNFHIPQHGGSGLKISFDSPVGQVVSVDLLGAVTSSITNIEYGAMGINLIFDCPTDGGENIDIRIMGQELQFFNTSHTEGSDNKNILKISNYLIQDKDIAVKYAKSLLQYSKDPFSKYEIRVRGDPTFEVGDIIGVDDPTDKIENLDLQIIQQVLEYDGGLKVTLKGRKTLSEHEWVFLMPWQPVYAEKTK